MSTLEERKTDHDYKLNYQHDEIQCGIAWDFFDKAIDLDVSVVALNQFSLEMEVAFYNRPEILNGAIKHSGDNKTGVGDGDDEQITINLKSLPSDCHSLWFIVNAFKGGNFSDVETARFTFYDSNKEQLHSNSITMKAYNNTAMLLGVLYRDINEMDWNYKKIEKAGPGLNFVESRALLESNLNVIYSNEIISDRPADKTKKYELKKSDQYVLDPSINKITLGLGWDPASNGIDVDASVLVFDQIENSDDLKQEGIVNFSNLKYGDSIQHHGDNLTGKGSGDDEKIDMFLDRMGSDKIDILCVIINIYSGSSSFSEIRNCFARLIDDDGNELCRYTLSGNYDTQAMIMCTINKKKNGCWSLNAVGIGCGGNTAQNSANAAKKVCEGKELSAEDVAVDNECCCVIL